MTPCRNPECVNKATKGSSSGLCQECTLRARRALRGKNRGGNISIESLLEYYDLGPASDEPINIEVDWGYHKTPRDETPTLPCPTLIASDAHAPSHDVQMFKRLRAVGALRGIKRLVLVGDTHDFASLSRHRTAYYKSASCLENMMSVLVLLSRLAEHFEHIDITMGNHETNRIQVQIERMVKAGIEGVGLTVDYLISFSLLNRSFRQQATDLLSKFMEDKAEHLRGIVRWHSSSRVEIETPPHLDNYVLCHPRLYSRHAPQAEKKLWPKHLKPVGGAHGHLFGVSLSPNGAHPVFQWGCMTHPTDHAYVTDEDTDHPYWAKGFCLINDRGIIEFFVDNPYLTDWEEVDAMARELDDATAQ